MTLTVTKDFRAELHDVRDQGRRPTCLSFAASDVHRHARKHPECLCIEWLFFHVCKQAGTDPQAGTTIPDTRAVLKAIGQPEEPIWPYCSKPPNPAAWNPPSKVGTLFRCGSSDCAGGLQGLRQRVDQGVPVVIGMFVSDAFICPQTWERVGSEVILGADIGRPVDGHGVHAVVVVGHGEYGGDPVMLIRNSWGSDWGNDGHAWVRESHLAPRLAGAFFISKGDGDVLQSDGHFADPHRSARLG